MKLKATIFLLLSMCFSSTPLAQQRPELFSQIERAFQENEPAWRAGRPLVSDTSDRIRQSLVFRSGRLQASVDVAIWRSGEEARKAFAGESLAFDKRVAKRMVRGRLPELGDENHLWTNLVGAEWPVLKFRRDNINVTVFAPSVAVARRFAQHVLQQMPTSEQGPAPDPDQRGDDAPDPKSPPERAGGPPIRRLRGESQGALRFLEMRKHNLQVTIAGTDGCELLPELDHRPTDKTIVKKRDSAFFGTDLEATLRHVGPHLLVVAGINTHACVRTTVIDAYQRDYEVVVAAECIASYDEAHHEMTKRYLDGAIARLLPNREIIKMLVS